MIRLTLLALLAGVWLASPAAAACEEITFEGIPFTVCETQAGVDDLRLWQSDDNGRLYGSFGAVDAALAPDARLGFAMNGGMFHQDRRPVGYYVEEYQQFTPLVDGGGYGNFGLVPNGVFCITDTAFRVIETNAFRADPPDCRFATQSGPMLVIGGALHPKLHADSASLNIRNGVGTSADGTRAVFAISDRPVTFYTFARLFRDRLGLPDALFLDGRVSRLYAPDLGRNDIGFPLGPIIGTVVGAQD